MGIRETPPELLRAEPHKTAPAVDGLQIGSFYQPSAATIGAFHDFVDLGQGHVAIFVADVSGPPTAGPTIVQRMREHLRSTESLHDVFIRMNRELSGDALRGTFVTMFVAAIDTTASTLTICSAGHNAMIFVTPRSRQPEFVNTRGLAMGIDRGPQFESMVAEQTLPFEPGDRLLLYTDGLRKMSNPGGHEYGAERVAERFRDLVDRECPEILSSINDGLTSFRGGMVPVDDFVMIAVRRLPIAKRAAEPFAPPASRSPLEEHLDTSLMQIQELKRRLRSEQEKIDKDRQEGVRQIQELRLMLEQALNQANAAGRIEQLLLDRKDLEDKVAAMRSELDQTKKAIPDTKKYQDQIESLKKMVADLQAALDAAGKTKKSSKRMDQEAAKKIAILEEQVTLLKADTGRLTAVDAETAQLKNEIKARAAENADLKSKAAQADEEADLLKRQLEEFRAKAQQVEQLQAQASEVAPLKRQLAELQGKKADRAAKLEKKIADEMESLRSQLAEAHKRDEAARRLQADLDQRNAEAETLRSQLAESKKQDEAARQWRTELEQRRAEAESLRSQLAELKKHAGKGDQTASQLRIELENKIKELTATTERLQAEVTQAREQGLAAAADKEKRLWQEVVQREGRIAELQRELEKIRKDHEEYKASQGGMTAVMTQLKNDLEQELRARDAAIKEREEHIRKLQGLMAKQGEESETKIHELTQKLGVLNQSLNTVKPLLVRAQEEIKDKTAKIDRLEKAQSTRVSLPEIQTGTQPVAPPPPPTTRLELSPPKPDTSRKPRFMKTMRAPIPVIKPNPPAPPAASTKGDSAKAISPEPETMASGLVRMPDVQFTISRSRFGLRKTLAVAHLRGISEKTLAATVTEPLDEGTSVHVKLLVKKFGDTIELDGHVIDQSILTMNELYEITVLIEKISEPDKRRLANALNYYSSDAGRAQH